MNAEQVAEVIRQFESRIADAETSTERRSAFIIAREIVRAIANRGTRQNDKNNG